MLRSIVSLFLFLSLFLGMSAAVAEDRAFYEAIYQDPNGLINGEIQGKVMDLDSCLRRAIGYNHEILAAGKGIDVAYWKAEEAHRHGIPAVSYEYRLAPVPRDVDNPMTSFFSGDISVFNNLKLEVGAPITTFGQLKLGQALGDLAIIEATARKRDKSADVVQKVYQLYYGILLATEIRGLLNKALDALEDNTRKIEKEEYPDQLQMLENQTIAFELYKQLDESTRKQELAKRALRIQMGYSQNAEIEFKRIPLAPLPGKLEDFSTYVDRTKESGVKRALLEAGLDAKKTLYDIEKRKLAPKLLWGSFFELGHAPAIEGEDDGSSINRPFNYKKAGAGLQLEGEFDWASARSKIRRTEADYYQALLQKKAAIEGIELELHEAYVDAEEKQRLMDRAHAAQKISHQVVFLTKSNMDIGVGEKKDYIDALKSYLLFQGRYYEAVYDYNNAFIKLKRISSTLDDEIAVLQ